MATLGERLPIEIQRCQELLVAYREIGPPGKFAAMMLEQSIADAHKSMIEQDPLAMLRAYTNLKDSQ